MSNNLIVRNKNAIVELLKSGTKFEKIVIVENLRQDEQTQQIIQIAKNKHVPIVTESLRNMAKRRNGDTHEVICAYLSEVNLKTLPELLNDLNQENKNPFFLLINRIDFDNNIGLIARTAFAAGVNGIFYQGDDDKFLNEDTLHFSIGSIARIPIVKMNIFEALKELDKNGIPTYSLQMNGSSIYKENLSGPAAFVLGSESKGVSDQVASKCSKTISIPMQNGIDSLNVAISASIVIYEKVRQQGYIRI